MAKFLTTNKNRPCPVCGKTNSNCRIMPNDGVLCMTFPDGENHPDYRFAKPTSNGQWGIYHPHKADDFDRQGWEQRKAEKEARELEIERQRREKCLSPEQRDREYRAILSQLTLSDGDRRYLKNRGVLPEVIANCRSVEKWQKLAHPAHINLPGVNQYGNGLTSPYPGILVPIADHLGLVTALRLHDPNHKTTGNPKYIWLSSAKRGIKPNLPNGELPAAVHYPDFTDPTNPGKFDTIGFCEGRDCQANTPAHRYDFPVIGFSGHTAIANSPQQIQALLDHTGATRIVIFGDGNCITNEAVNGSLLDTSDQWEEKQTVEFAWWGQCPEIGDIDEIGPDVAIEFISPDLFRQKSPAGKKAQGKLAQLADWLTTQTKRLKPKGFGAIKPEGEVFTGDRSNAWLDAVSRGNAVLDASFMGLGKSHGVPEITNPYGGKIWYISSGHRNPTIEAIATDFTDLIPRNQYGFYRDSQGKLRKATAETPEEAIVIERNCIRADLFPMLTNLGYNPNDGGGSNPICESCPMANICAHTPGWYRADRRAALNNAHKIRCDIKSMPRDWDYSKDIAVCDEPSQQLSPTKTIEFTREELLAASWHYRETLAPDQWEALDRLLMATQPLFGECPHYGWEHSDLLEKLADSLGEPLEMAMMAIAANPLDLTDLFPKAERETAKDNLSPAERKKWGAGIKALNAMESGKAYRESERNLDNLTPNALGYFLMAVTRQPGTILRVKKGWATLTIDRRHEYAFLNRAKGLIFLDATAQGSNLTAIAGIDRPLEVIRSQTPPLANLTVTQIEVAGIGSKDISDTAISRINSLMETLGDIPAIGPKGWRDKFDFKFAGNWFSDSRGSNAFAGNPRLAFIGLPNPNVGALEDEYLALRGNLDGFKKYYSRRVNEEIFQGAAGRQRSHRYPDRQFEAVVICPPGTDLSWLVDYGITVNKTNGFLIDSKAGTESQLAKAELLGAIHDLMGDGLKVTQKAIASKLGKSQQAISKVLTNAGVKLSKLLQGMASSLSNKNTTPPYKSTIRPGCILPDEIYREFAWFLEIDVTALAMEVVEIIAAGGWEGFAQWIEALPIAVRARILGIIYALFSPEPELIPPHS